jgi:hypothetical protein
MIIIEGKLVGVFQKDNFWFARITPDFKEFEVVDIPITIDQFHKLKLDVPAKITVEFNQ